MRTTVGQVLVNAALPPKLRDYRRELDKDGMMELMRRLADEYPDKYKDVVHRLHEIGMSAATSMGSTVTLAGLLPQAARKRLVDSLQAKAQIIAVSKLSDTEKEEKLTDLYTKATDQIKDIVYKQAMSEKNPFALQVMSGARGNPTQLNSLIGADLIAIDHHGRSIPVPITHSYSEGLDPAEYWAASYGARQGEIATKMATRNAGYLGKQLARTAHRLIVTSPDCGTRSGLPVDASDLHNEGALLAQSVGGYRRNAAITPKMIKSLGERKIVVRSPITCEAGEGICAKCAGIRESGKLPKIGDHVGIAAAQALSERLSQSQLRVKHTGGDVGGASVLLGFDLINKILQIPKHFTDEAATATRDGRISKIEAAPQGGWHINIGEEQIWSANKPTVQIGATVEAGDLLSGGLPNPSKIVEYKGIGEGRRQFVRQLRKAFEDSRLFAHRRNIELFTKGLINHVQISDPDGIGDALPNDVLPFDTLRRIYKPRAGFQTMPASRAIGQYLEKPALHYTIGTRVTPSMVKSLREHDVKNVSVHQMEPGFSPRMVRAEDTLKYDPDWMTRLMGERLTESTLRAVHRGEASKERSTSFVPSLAKGTEFYGPGRTGKF